MEVNKLPNVESLDGFLVTHSCIVCKKEYVENFQRKCFAFNMILESNEDVCIRCRLYRAAKLESAIWDMAEDLGFVVRHPREASATLLGKIYLIRKEKIPVDLQKKLDEIPLTYPKNLKNKICPVSCERCTEFREDKTETEFEVVNESETHEFDADVAHEIIEEKLKLLSKRNTENDHNKTTASTLQFNEDHFNGSTKG